MEFYVAEDTGQVHEVARTVTDYLVRNVDVAAFRVFGCWIHGPLRWRMSPSAFDLDLEDDGVPDWVYLSDIWCLVHAIPSLDSGSI